MFGRLDQLKLREIMAEYDSLKARVLELEISMIKDPLEKIAARNKGKALANGSPKPD